ncbi:MAG: ASCH domain-containing protein [Alphaproteobacteria bacterium]|uniref:ASCH domain-containing protein n=1 Tax=Candidatus Nitrobium versatile TaxID=2884831 RepID=A0A953SDJ4_9BACT|nr:ASCH domain-containing protein [Candidatus Nitrobium versatile]
MTFKVSFRFAIKPEWENAIREGRKTIDVRFNAEKFSEVKIGDSIHYGSTEVRVTSIRAYPGVSDLLAHEDWRKIVPEAKDHQQAFDTLVSLLRHNAPPHGILALVVEVVK